MASSVQTVKVKLDTREFDKGISKATAALGALVSAATITSIVKTTAKFQDLETSLASVYGSTKLGAQAFKDIQKLSTKTQFGVEDLSTTFIKLGSAGIQPTEELLKTFTDAAAVTTDQIGSLTAITDLFSRNTAGGLGLEDLNRLADKGLPVFDMLNEKLGLSRLEISEVGKTAEGSAKILAALSESINERFGGSTEARLANLSTLMSNFSIGLTNAAANIGGAMAPALGGLITQVTTMLDNSSALTTVIGEALGVAFTTLGSTIEFVSNNMSIFGAAAITAAVAAGASGLAGALGKAKVAMIALNTAVKANPIGFLAAAVVALLGYLSFENGLGKTFAQLKAVVNVLGRALGNLGSYISGVLDPIIVGIKTAFFKFTDGILKAYNAIARIIPGMEEVEKSSSELASELGDNLHKKFVEIKEDVIEVAGNIVQAVPLIAELGNAWTTTGAAMDEAERMMAKVNKTSQDGFTKLKNQRVVTATEDPEVKKQADKLAKQFQDLQASLMSEKLVEQTAFKDKLSILDRYYEGRQHLDTNYQKLKEQLETKHQKKMASIQQAETQGQVDIFKSGQFQLLDLKDMTDKQMVDFTKQAGLEVLGELAKQNKAAFQAQKAYNIAMAIMNTANGVTRALALPFPFNLAVAGLIGAAGAIQIATIAGQKYQGRQTGGLVQNGTPYVVGENGPEMFMPNQTGTIIPNRNMSSGKDVNVTFNINAIDATGVDELLVSRKAVITNIIRDAATQKGERSPV
tara:strand:- start:111 stop:2354 length:2244 start_codon:yes stop_codon:yes gene_type:complete